MEKSISDNNTGVGCHFLLQEMGTYISLITLNVNGLNAPTTRHRLAEGIQNKTHIYAVYKKPTSDLKTHID